MSTTTIDWPEALIPAACSLNPRKNGRIYDPMFGGPPQAVGVPGSRWMLSCNLPEMVGGDIESGQADAFTDLLSGGATFVRAWNFTRPEPLGSLRGVPLLAADAAIGAPAISINGGASVNMLPGAGFDIDSDADGIADYWIGYSLGTTGAITRTMSSSSLSGLAQRVDSAGLGTTAGDRAGMRQFISMRPVAGTPLTFSASLIGNTGSKGAVYIRCLDSSDAILDQATSADLTLSSSSWQRAEVTITVPAGTVKVGVFAWQHSNTSLSGANVRFDEAQLQIATAATTYTKYLGTGNGKNLLPGAGFDADGNSDGLANSWTAYSFGTTGTITRSLSSSSLSGMAQKVDCATLGTTEDDRAGVRQDVAMTPTAGSRLTFSAAIIGNTGSKAVVRIQCQDSSGSALATVLSSSLTLSSTDWQRASATVTAPTGTVKVSVHIWQHSNTTLSGSTARFDEALLEIGAVATDYEPFGGTLKAGDMVGVAGQLFRVASGVEADSDGVLTVPITTGVRAALAEDAQVILERPTATFMSPSFFNPTADTPGLRESTALELVEVWES